MFSNRPQRIVLFVAVVGAIVTALVLGIILLGGLLEMDDWYQWWPHISLEEILQLIRSYGHWGIAAAIGLMIIHSFIPFPAELVAIANGMIYGPFWGTVITWIGAMLGALLSFGLARRFGRPFVRRLLTHKKALLVDDWLASHGAGALMFSRFIPVIAFNLINYAAGLTRMSWWTFTWVTGLGILPLTALMVIMGHHIKSLPWVVWLILLSIGLVLWWATHRVVRRLTQIRLREPTDRIS